MIRNLECGTKYEVGGETRAKKLKSVPVAYSLFFMQAVITAYNICTTELHSNSCEKRNTVESSIIYLQYNFLLYVHVFVHEAIYHTESTFTSITNMYLSIHPMK